MATPGGVNSGGFRPRVGQDQVARKDNKTESKETKGAEGKGEVRSGQAGAAKAKGKAKSKDLGATGSVVGGSDQYVVEDDEQRDRKRRRLFFAQPEEEGFKEQDSTRDNPGLGHINAEFRGQVASGLAAGRSFTKGSVGGLDRAKDDDDDDEDGEDER